MSFNRSLLFPALALFTVAPAYAGVTSVTIGSSASVLGENWAPSSTWYVRAIVIDSGSAAVGKISPAATFDTRAGAATPEDFTITIDAGIVGPKIRVYRSTAPFEPGDVVEFADFDVCPCAIGPVQLTGDKHLPNGLFRSTVAALPVQLQSFNVD